MSDASKTELRDALDPRGITILKRKLLAGEISPQVFKDVLRRQMVKARLSRHRSLWDAARGALARLTRGREVAPPPEETPASPFQPGPLDMAELFRMARVHREAAQAARATDLERVG